ncbi:MAG: transglutaminase domain-containing protein [Kofleriaceae bacterium]
MRNGLAIAVIAVLGFGGVTGIAIAQRKGRTLHQDLPAPTDGTRMVGSGSSANAFRSGDKMIPKPALDDPKSAPKDEPVLGSGGFGADRKTFVTPDDNTGSDPTLHYASVYNPDIIPFKRMSALDGVADNYNLHIKRTALSELRVGGVRDDATRDLFRGSVLIKLTPNKDIPLPSVAPDMRILAYEVKPRIALKFSKDGADNFYVRSDESNASGTYRLNLDVDADAGYFATSLPTKRTYKVNEVIAQTPQELRPSVPDSVRREGQITLDKIGVAADWELGPAFNAIVRHFRAFEAKSLPSPGSGNLYRDLCDSQAGVCRHRAFAFMITANTLGIPTRYVSNEAHAFVEVWFPERSWQRIDLGGAALRMEVTGARDKTLHRERSPDPFDKPQSYKNSYTQLEGDIAGLSPGQLDDKRKPLDQAPPSGAPGPGVGSGAAGSGAGLGSGAIPNPFDRVNPDQSLDPIPHDPKKADLDLEVTLADASAYRGAELRIEGHATSRGRPVAGRHIDVFLAPPGRDGRNSSAIGRVVTGPDGRFSERLEIPASVDVATYEILLSSPPDALYNAALSK